MKPRLVYLHIPKSAGTSQRTYMTGAVGKDRVFWYGLDLDTTEFEASDVGEAVVIGGHRELQFYPDGFNALYTAVVRDPIERAVSYFNYCTRVSDKLAPAWKAERERELADWVRKGVDPDSMVASIENCELFRNRVSNYQCAYLSRYGATFADVQRTMEEENLVVGAFDNLDAFNRFFQLDLQFNRQNVVKANVGEPGYSSKILAEPGLIEMITSVNREDIALYEYVRDTCDGLWKNAVNVPEVSTEIAQYVTPSNLQVEKGEFDWSKVDLYCKGIAKLNLDVDRKIPLMIENRGDFDVVFTELEDRSYGIGWVLLDEAGQRIDGVGEVAMVKVNIPARNSKGIKVDVCISTEQLSGKRATSIEFCVVDCGTWVRDKFPHRSAWIRLHA